MFSAWDNLFVSSLAGKYLVRPVLDGSNHVAAEERRLNDLNARTRAVNEEPDGALYATAALTGRSCGS